MNDNRLLALIGLFRVEMVGHLSSCPDPQQSVSGSSKLVSHAKGYLEPLSNKMLCVSEEPQLNKLSPARRVLLQDGVDGFVACFLGPRMRCCPQLRVRFDWVGSPLQHYLGHFQPSPSARPSQRSAPK